MADDPSTAPKCASCSGEEQSGLSLQRCSRCQNAVYCSKHCQAADWKEHKKICGKPPTPSKVMLLSLEKLDFLEDMYTPFVNNVKAVAEVEEITTKDAAFDFFQARDYRIVVVATDAAISKKGFTALRSKIIEFVKDGGVFVYGFQACNFTTPPDMDKLWSDFALPWKYGDYHRTDFKVNKTAHHADTSSLVSTYSQKAVYLSNVEKKHAVYLPTSHARIQSHVFAPTTVEDLPQSPAVFRACGKG